MHYLKLAVEMNGFFYAITGAILSYYFASKISGGVAGWALVLPLAMSIGFTGLFFWSAAKIPIVVRTEVQKICNAIGLGVFPEIRVLT